MAAAAVPTGLGVLALLLSPAFAAPGGLTGQETVSAVSAAAGGAGGVVGAAGSVGVASASAGAAARAEPFELTLENIHRHAPGGAREVAIAPDGRTLAVVGAGPEGPGIYRLHLDGAGTPAAEPAFWLEGRAPVWSSDGASLAFLREGQLWVVSAEDGRGPEAARRLTSGMRGVRSAAWSADDGALAFYAADSGHQDVWLVPADGSESPRQLTRELMSVDDTRFAPAWSPDGRRLAVVGNRADYWSDDLWLVDAASGEMRQLTDELRVIGEVSPWSPDGSRIAVLATRKDEFWFLDLADIYLVEPETGAAEKVEMEVHATAYRYRPFWSGDGRLLYFPYQERGEHHLWSVPVEGGPATRVTNVGGVKRGVDATPDGEAFAFIRSSPTRGADVWFARASGGPARQVTRFAPDWRGLQEPIEVSYRSFDGLYIQGFLYLPPGLEGGARCPALVEVHGGGTNSYLRGPNLTEQWLAAQGYVVLAINYRGGSGFGRAFQEIAREDWLNDQARDPGAAAAYLRGLPFVGEKVGIYGYSYGGMQAMSAITRTPDAFDAAVPMGGIYTSAGTFEEMDRLGQVFAVDGHGGLPEERPEIYEKTNTVDRLDRVRVPVLVMHGDRDVRAPFSNFTLAVERLEALGKEVETATYPEGHGFRDPENRIDMYRRLETFFRERLGECAMPG